MKRAFVEMKRKKRPADGCLFRLYSIHGRKKCELNPVSVKNFIIKPAADGLPLQIARANTIGFNH